VPLIVMTADRPPELRDVGAGQAIDQVKLYGSAAKWFVEVGNHEPTRETAVHVRALACRAYATARGDRPGPVHLNFPLREPLAPLAEELDPDVWRGRDSGHPWISVREAGMEPTEVDLEVAAKRLRTAPRGAIVCGPLGAGAAWSVTALGQAAGWPVLADATSGLRFGGHELHGVVAHYDLLLRSDRFAEEHRPDVVVRLGDTPTSKPLRAWLAGAPQVVVEPHPTWHEPTRSAEEVVREDPGEWCLGVAFLGGYRHDERWLASWAEADAVVPELLREAPAAFEPRIWNAVADAAPEGSTLWVASSMPIRDVEAFLPVDEKQLSILANRGANGIDGTVASAAGAALAHPDSRTYLLIGDVALVHDLGGLLAARRLGADLTVVCANNGGGNIFDFLPVAGAAESEAYERHVATPPEVDLEQVAALAGMRYTRAAGAEEVRAAVEAPGLVEVPTDRSVNVEWHREVAHRVASRLG
jgi:2-succinyl-5-enolpyruvyl-6-hydroxy-3-cyclohexene-1-carboxylate synthase